MSSDWISAAAAIEMVRAVTALIQAPRAICTRAHAGLVAARAKRLIIGSKVRDEIEIPKSFWWAEGEAALKQNWGTGDFETWIDSKIECRAFGVEFKRDDIESMLPDRRAEVSEREKLFSPPMASGGRPASGHWRTWIAELVLEIHERGIPDGVGSQGQEELIKRIADGLAERGVEGLGRSTVQPVVQAVLDRLRSAGN